MNSKQPILIAMDLEGVLVPEIWIAFSEKTGIKELRLTTRDISDYDALMKNRLRLLKENHLKLQDIQQVIATMEPLPGAVEYMKWVDENFQSVILSDTFYQFAKPLMKQLGWPTLFCNSLIVDAEGNVTDYAMRIKNGKYEAVKAFKTLNFDVVAMGDSYNDTAMLGLADCGILFRPSENVKREFPQFPVAEDYKTVQDIIKRFASRQ